MSNEKTIESQWREFIAEVTPEEGLDDETLEVLRETFMVGAGAVLKLAADAPKGMRDTVLAALASEVAAEFESEDEDAPKGPPS